MVPVHIQGDITPTSVPAATDSPQSNTDGR